VNASGLPDFDCFNIPKRGKIYQITIKIPNGHKIYQMDLCEKDQMAVKYTNICHCNALKNLPKKDFWFENMLSGNPGMHSVS
jgi:hypothetical protein